MLSPAAGGINSAKHPVLDSSSAFGGFRMTMTFTLPSFVSLRIKISGK
jgi:hypothetical protein